MTRMEAIESLLRAKGLLDPVRIQRVKRAREWNERPPNRHSGRTINVTCEIVDQPTPPGPEGGTKQYDHVEYDDRGAAR